MKKLLIVVLASSFALFSGAMLAKDHGKGNASSLDKVIIDHKGKDIVISVSAWPAHCKHGDSIRDAGGTILADWTDPCPDGDDGEDDSDDGYGDLFDGSF